MTKVYSRPNCVQCDATKRHLLKLGLEFEEIDLTEDIGSYQELVGMGFQAIPVVITENDSWAGYQPDKIEGLVK